MAKDILKLIKERYTTYEFSDKEVPKEKLNKIIEAGQWTPSFMNLQPWRFLIIKDKKKIKTLIDTSFYGGFHTPPKIIIALAIIKSEYQNKQRQFGEETFERDHAHMSLAMAAYGMILEAESLNVQSAILSPNKKKVSENINSNGEEIPLLIGLGYEKKNSYKKKRERKKLKQLLNISSRK
jgi:nitroreductase